MSSNKSFEILVRQHSAMLNAFIRSMAYDSSIVDDVFQETIVTAWQRLDDFDADRPFGPWLRGIARNHLLSMSRKEKRHQDRILMLVEQRVSLQLENVDNVPGDTYADRLISLRDCIQSLPPDSREAIDLVYIRGMKPQDASLTTSVPYETFRKRLQRARAILIRCLQSKNLLLETG